MASLIYLTAFKNSIMKTKSIVTVIVIVILITIIASFAIKINYSEISRGFMDGLHNK